jgi:hypothetical protein
MISDAIIESWSRERGRGSVRSETFGSLPFDAAVAEVGTFVVGESVTVTLEPAGGSFRVVRVTPNVADDNAGAPFPYNLPIWRSSWTAVSPSGAHEAEIAQTSEHSMGNPRLGSLRTSFGLVLPRCSPSFVWSSCSRYLAVAQLHNFMGIFFGIHMLVVDCERRLIWSSKRYRGWLQPESFNSGLLEAVLHPFSTARRLSWRVPDALAGFRARPYADHASPR